MHVHFNFWHLIGNITISSNCCAEFYKSYMHGHFHFCRLIVNIVICSNCSAQFYKSYVTDNFYFSQLSYRVSPLQYIRTCNKSHSNMDITFQSFILVITFLVSLPCTQSVKPRCRKQRKNCRAYRIWKMLTAAVHVDRAFIYSCSDKVKIDICFALVSAMAGQLYLREFFALKFPEEGTNFIFNSWAHVCEHLVIPYFNIS